ncbi:hypothetical protein ACFQY4_12860 [Catellatospora bangladeshensis]|uniref:Tetratricopeptide repeat protein n=1 Tax=Catellatospora bangladeshensis TaxID=310355 RepID=A0A8J3NML5_9ACTN|nr:hypothetical protein [Catellatospora bangladeshensis]GIF86095.1 hypothetical protein Cba03nite_74440 [Catellatospora bangladeshensis]
MPVGEHVVARAREHIAAGSLASAQDLLSAALATVPPDPAQAAPATAEAVVLQTGVLLGLGDPYAARGWAAYGYAAYRNLHGERDRRTLHALGLLAAVLARVGVHARAVTRYLDLIAAYTELDGPDSDRVRAARADLATVEHAQGHCVTARLRLATVVDEHRQRHGLAHPVGVRMQLRLAAMWRDCGGFNDAHELLTEAREDAAGLDPDDPVHALLAAAAHAVADPRHRCGVGLAQDVPLAPSGVSRPAPAEAAPTSRQGSASTTAGPEPVPPGGPETAGLTGRPGGPETAGLTGRPPAAASVGPPAATDRSADHLPAGRASLPPAPEDAVEDDWLRRLRADPGAAAEPVEPGDTSGWAPSVVEREAVAAWDHLTPVYDAPSVLAAPTFTATVYLPPYLPGPAAAGPEPGARPAGARRAEAAAQVRRLPQHSLVLVAACVGIVAIALLFALLVSSVSR